MKSAVSLLAVVLVIATAQMAFAELPSEYITNKPDGTIKTKGTYTRNADGRVVRFDVVDGDGAALYSEIPFYATDGRIIRADRLNPDGTLSQVVVFLENTAIVLDPSGKVVDTQNFSQLEYLQSIKAGE